MVGRITKSPTLEKALEYYTQLERQDEQLEGMEKSGRIKGRGAEWLEIEGQEVDKQNFRMLLEGKDPRDGESMVFVQPTRVPGWDFTFSPDKSVSVAWAASETSVAQGIEAAQRQAATAAMEALEQQYGTVRVWNGKETTKENVSGLVWARFDHVLSRDLDPQLHTHNYIFNLGLSSDGKFRAINSRDLYKAQQAAQLVYHAQLAHNLEKMGFQLEMHSGNNFRIAGISEAVKNANSNRREAILAAMAGYKHQTYGAAANAAKMTRNSKVQVNFDLLLNEWQSRNAALGFGPEQAKALLTKPKFKDMRPVSEALANKTLERHGLKVNFAGASQRPLPPKKLLGSVAKQNTALLELAASSVAKTGNLVLNQMKPSLLKHAQRALSAGNITGGTPENGKRKKTSATQSPQPQAQSPGRAQTRTKLDD